MAQARYPSLYQINTRVWLTELSQTLGRSATLDDVPDAELDRLAAMGFDWVWFLSVWQTGPGAQQVSRTNAGWRHEFQETLPDLREAHREVRGFSGFFHGVEKRIIYATGDGGDFHFRWNLAHRRGEFRVVAMKLGNDAQHAVGVNLVVDFAEVAFDVAVDGDGVAGADLPEIECVLRGSGSVGGFFG